VSPGTPAIPGRPRLADHALARRHFIDGDEVVVVHDARTGDLVRMPPRAWALIEAADGTRDLGGLLLAASQRGALVRSSEVVSVLTDLQAAGLLTDGIDPFALDPPAPVCDAGTPLDVLPFTLVCDGSGACCATYSTVRFTEDEAERARVLLPDANGGRGRVFLPLAGSGAQRARAATAIDGACVYLAEDGACELHRAHGAAAKPSGCAIYPATFVFDGEVVRVSLGVECACAAKSLGRTDGVPLVPAGAAARGDLPAGAQVVTLPEVIEIAAGKTAPRDAVVRWSRAALRGADPADAVAFLWSLAARVEAGDLSEEGVRAAEERAAPPDDAALAPWIEALAERTAAKLEAAERWRSRRDRVREASRSLAEAAASLKDEASRRAALAGEGAPRPLEAFHVKAALHGHALLGEIPLADALRDRAMRIILARMIRGVAYPLPLVEAMMRAQGVKEYARAVAR
jgi:lysine-N-methylase